MEVRNISYYDELYRLIMRLFGSRIEPKTHWLICGVYSYWRINSSWIGRATALPLPDIQAPNDGKLQSNRLHINYQMVERRA
jgi:hypothetical protein